MNVIRTKRMILIELAIVFSLISIVIILSVIKFFSTDFKEEEEFTLSNHKVVNKELETEGK